MFNKIVIIVTKESHELIKKIYIKIGEAELTVSPCKI